MRKIIALGCMLFAVTLAKAQSEEIKFGVKAGVNFSGFNGDGGYDAKVGGYVGALADVQISGNFHLQPELLLSLDGAENAGLFYARIPIVGKYYILENLSLQAGPQIGLKLGGNDKIKDQVKSFDFGLTGGAAYEFDFGLFVDARFNAGALNISEISGIDFANAGFMLGAGYRF